jgi:hypothetical protein
MDTNDERKAYQPGLAVRLALWFGIYLFSFLLLIWYWPGEIHDSSSPISIPEGLIWLGFGLFGPGMDRFHEAFLPLVYGLYVIHLVLFVTLRGSKAFWILLLIFIFMACLSSYGFYKYGGIVIGMSDRGAEKSN